MSGGSPYRIHLLGDNLLSQVILQFGLPPDMFQNGYLPAKNRRKDKNNYGVETAL